MQSLELSGSFIIGGIVLLALSALFYFYIDYSNSKKINEITTVTAIELKDVIDYDFNKIGYRASNAVSSFNDTSIVFNSDLDNNGSVDTVSYSFSNNKLTRRVSPGNNRFVVPNVSDFQIICYDSTNSITNLPANVRGVNVNLLFDNASLIANTNFFSTSQIEASYYIRN